MPSKEMTDAISAWLTAEMAVRVAHDVAEKAWHEHREAEHDRAECANQLRKLAGVGERDGLVHSKVYVINDRRAVIDVTSTHISVKDIEE